MKKEFILLILIVLIGTNLINSQELEGELFAIGPQKQNLSIFVLPSPPIISIISPTNTTYSNTKILFNYTSTLADSTWFIYNNTNITLTTPVFLELLEGSHTLYLYANNTIGATSQNISFTIDLTPPEQPTPPPSTGTGGSSPSGSTPPQQQEPEIPVIIGPLILDKDNIQTNLELEDTQQETITIKNLGQETLIITIENPELQEFLNLDQTNFALLPGEEKIITLSFITQKDSIIQSYSGKLILKTTGIEKEILINFNISEKEIEIPRQIKEFPLIIWIILIAIIILIILIKYKNKREKISKKEKILKRKKKKEKTDLSFLKKIINLALPFNQSK